jgi:hypothetical protein
MDTYGLFLSIGQLLVGEISPLIWTTSSLSKTTRLVDCLVKVIK